MNIKSNIPFYLKLSCILICILIAGYLAIITQHILVPLMLALIFATPLVSVCSFMETKFRLPRTLAALISTICLASIICLVMYILIVQVAKFGSDWPAFQDQLRTSFYDLQLWIQEKYGIEKSSQLDYIRNSISKIFNAGTDILGKTLSSISSIMMMIIFTFLYTLFLLIYRHHLVHFLVMSFGPKHKETVMDIARQIQVMVKKYLIGLMLQLIIVTILSFIAYTIIGIKYNYLLAVLTGILNTLPYVGIITAMLIVVLITFTTASASKALFVVISLIIIHAIDGNLIVPKIVGSKVKLNSLVVIIGLVLGEMIWGVYGMLLTIPLLAIAKIIFNRVDNLNAWGFLLGQGDEKKHKKEDTEDNIS